MKSIFTLCAASFVALALINPALAEEPMWLEPRLHALTIEQTGPFVHLGDGGILCVKNASALVSNDDGKSWQAYPMFGEQKLKARPELALVRTAKGTIVCVFMDDLDKQWKWDAKSNSAAGKIWLHVWSARSLDEGKTWTDLQKIQDGYCGAIRDMIQTSDGDLVLPNQLYLPDKSRHATVPFVSADEGKTWKATGLLDLGGRGHHDGSIEATLVQLRDERIWMLLRTTHDYFWQSYSSDGGLNWSEMTPTTIDASSSPGIVKRLASGRLVLAWNRLYPEGKTEVARRAGQSSEKLASWFRDELSIAFSDDDGKVWTKPVVIARQPGKRVSYPWIFERRPGVLWVTTMQGDLKAELNEADFVTPAATK